jgi:hypothetical protein
VCRDRHLLARAPPVKVVENLVERRRLPGCHVTDRLVADGPEPHRWIDLHADEAEPAYCVHGDVQRGLDVPCLACPNLAARIESDERMDPRGGLPRQQTEHAQPADLLLQDDLLPDRRLGGVAERGTQIDERPSSTSCGATVKTRLHEKGCGPSSSTLCVPDRLYRHLGRACRDLSGLPTGVLRKDRFSTVSWSVYRARTKSKSPLWRS